MNSELKLNSKLESIERFISPIEDTVVAICLIVVILGMAATVYSRYVISGAVIGLEDICVFAGEWMYFIGAAIATRKDVHIEGGMVTLVFKNPQKVKYIKIVAKVITMLFLAYVCINACLYFQMIDAIDIRTTSLKIPKVYFFGSVIVGVILMIFHELVGISKMLNEKN